MDRELEPEISVDATTLYNMVCDMKSKQEILTKDLDSTTILRGFKLDKNEYMLFQIDYAGDDLVQMFLDEEELLEVAEKIEEEFKHK